MKRTRILLVALMCVVLLVVGTAFANGPDSVQAGSCDFRNCGTMNCLIMTLASCIGGHIDGSLVLL